MKKQKFSGFTIIELLLVISIIGLLSSIVMVSLKGARESAKLASAKLFSANIKHALGAYILGEWNFDDGNPTIATDSSGNGLNAIIVGYSVDNNSFEKKGITTSGGAGPLKYIGGLSVPSGKYDIKSGSITIESWLKPLTTGNLNFAFASRHNPSWTVLDWHFGYNSVDKIAGGVTRDIGGMPNVCWLAYNVSDLTGDKVIAANKWNHVALTYQALTGELNIYINGKKAGQTAACGPGNIINSAGFLFSAAATYDTNISVDQIRIYDSSLNLSQIQQNYARGLIKISIEEFTGKKQFVKAY